MEVSYYIYIFNYCLARHVGKHASNVGYQIIRTFSCEIINRGDSKIAYKKNNVTVYNIDTNV